MWLKVLKYVVIGAKALGLDAKVKRWVEKKLGKVEDKLFDKVNTGLAKIDEVSSLLEKE